MKFRTDFVTNSSSSAFIALTMSGSKIYELFSKYSDAINAVTERSMCKVKIQDGVIEFGHDFDDYSFFCYPSSIDEVIDFLIDWASGHPYEYEDEDEYEEDDDVFPKLPSLAEELRSNRSEIKSTLKSAEWKNVCNCEGETFEVLEAEAREHLEEEYGTKKQFINPSKQKLLDYFNGRKFPALDYLYDSETEGIDRDYDDIDALYERCDHDMDNLKKELYSSVPDYDDACELLIPTLVKRGCCVYDKKEQCYRITELPKKLCAVDKLLLTETYKRILPDREEIEYAYNQLENAGQIECRTEYIYDGKKVKGNTTYEFY